MTQTILPAAPQAGLPRRRRVCLAAGGPAAPQAGLCSYDLRPAMTTRARGPHRRDRCNPPGEGQTLFDN